MIALEPTRAASAQERFGPALERAAVVVLAQDDAPGRRLEHEAWRGAVDLTRETPVCLPAGDYRLRAIVGDRDGVFQGWVSLAPGRSERVELIHAPDAYSVLGSLQVQVYDPEAPVANAQVVWLPLEDDRLHQDPGALATRVAKDYGFARGTCDAGGRLRVEGIQAGLYVVFAYREGRGGRSRPVTIEPGRTPRVDVELGPQPCGDVTLRCRDAETSVWIEAFQVERYTGDVYHGNATWWAHQGAFELHTLPGDAPTFVRTQCPGYLPVVLALRPTAPHTEVVVELRRPRGACGRVLLPPGVLEVELGAELERGRFPSVPVAPPAPGEDADWEGEGYVVAQSGAEFVLPWIEPAPGARLVLDFGPRLKVPFEQDGLRVDLRDLRPLEVLLLDASGAPLADESVSVHQGESFEDSTRTDAAGRVRFPWVPAGPLRVWSEHSVRTWSVAQGPCTLKASGAVPPPATVNGRVLGDDGAPLLDAWVDGHRVDEHGRFELTRTPGEVDLVVRRFDVGTRVVHLNVPPAGLRDLALRLSPGLRLAGEIRGAGGDRWDLALFQAERDVLVASSPVGTWFDFGRVEPGRYRLELRREGEDEGQVTTLDLDLPQERTDVVLVAPRTSSKTDRTR
ncbi:MAG: carboxypeptidase-like regulatory domain-containing protein [Planctomycetota bacterium]